MWKLCKTTALKWFEDNPGQRGAAIAYYAIFALAPLLLIAVALVGAIFGPQATADQLVGVLQGLVGPEVAVVTQALIKNASKSPAGRFSTIVGLVTAFIGAVGVMGELQQTLNAIWQVQPRPSRRAWQWLKDQLVSLLMVLGIGFFLLLSLIVSTGMAALNKSVTAVAPWSTVFWQWIDLVVSFILLTCLFAVTYKVIPAVRIAWRDVWVGAAVTSLLFTLGKILIGWYLVHSSVASAYGAAGSVIVLLLWVYYSAQVCLFGAEFTWVHAHQYGSGIVSRHDTTATTKT
jgi:membrane protein